MREGLLVAHLHGSGAGGAPGKGHGGISFGQLPEEQAGIPGVGVRRNTRPFRSLADGTGASRPI